MRIALIGLLLLSAGGVAYLLLPDDNSAPGRNGSIRPSERDRRPETGTNEGTGAPARLPDVMAAVRKGPMQPGSQQDLTQFVAACRAMGPDAVPKLLRMLRLDNDVRTSPRWQFKNGQLVDYPTIRATYIAALRGIPGQEAGAALVSLLPDATSAEEAYLISLSMQERGLSGWTEDLLSRAQKGNAANQQLRMQMAQFAAAKDPVGTAARIINDAPRGASKSDGRILMAATKSLPLGTAITTAEQLIDDQEVTYRTKQLLMSKLLERPDPEIYTALEELITRRDVGEELKIRAAHEAVTNPSFFVDMKMYQIAMANDDVAETDKIRRRFELRLRNAKSLVSTALGLDLETSTDKRAQSLNRRLQALKLK